MCPYKFIYTTTMIYLSTYFVFIKVFWKKWVIWFLFIREQICILVLLKYCL